MYLEKDKNISGHVVIIDPEIHKKAKLTRDEFLERVSHVKQIRTSVNYNYISFYICSLDEYSNLKKFHDLINQARFDFKNYHNFAIAVEPKLFYYFKNTEYTVIERQITFWLASLYYFVPDKRHILEQQLYKPLFEEILKLVDTYYKDFQLPNFQLLNQKLLDDNDETIFDEEDKCRKKYLDQCLNFYKTEPPEFLKSPFGYEHLENWGINDRYCFEFIDAYFLDKDWEFIILNSGKDEMGRVESRSDLWDKWKHAYANYDQRKTPIYYFFHPLDEDNKASKPSQKREAILQHVKDKVWKRDEGKCVECGRKEKLEFDHIIPVVKGGSSTYRNVQLLCEPCNRKKHSKLGDT